MISAFNRLATEKPALLGVNDTLTPGIDVHSPAGDYSVGGMIEGMVEMASQAASSREMESTQPRQEEDI